MSTIIESTDLDTPQPITSQIFQENLQTNESNLTSPLSFDEDLEEVPKSVIKWHVKGPLYKGPIRRVQLSGGIFGLHIFPVAKGRSLGSFHFGRIEEIHY